MTGGSGSFDNWTESEWKEQFRTLRANSLAAIFETGKYVQGFRREFRAHPERWGVGAAWTTVCVRITELSNSTCSMYETVWRVLGDVETKELECGCVARGWKRDKLPSSLRTLYHIARAFEINHPTVLWAMIECNHCRSAFSDNPIHPDMSWEDAERLVAQAQVQADFLKTSKAWKAKFEKDCLAAGLSKQAIDSLTCEQDILVDIYEHRQEKEYMAEVEAALMSIVTEADKRIVELEGRSGI